MLWVSSKLRPEQLNCGSGCRGFNPHWSPLTSCRVDSLLVRCSSQGDYDAMLAGRCRSPLAISWLLRLQAGETSDRSERPTGQLHHAQKPKSPESLACDRVILASAPSASQFVRQRRTRQQPVRRNIAFVPLCQICRNSQQQSTPDLIYLSMPPVLRNISINDTRPYSYR